VVVELEISKTTEREGPKLSPQRNIMWPRATMGLNDTQRAALNGAMSAKLRISVSFD
jgi:hypothetical protein